MSGPRSRAWFDQKNVAAIFSLGNSAVALAVQALCKERKRIDVVIAAGTADLTGKDCSPYGVHWTCDNYSAAKAPVLHLMREARRKWFMIVSDYAFGYSLESNATAILKAQGGEIVGRSVAPLGEIDYGAHLIKAASCGAETVGICAGGADFINIVKQMGEFRLMRRNIVPAALHCSLTNIHSLGLPITQGLIYSQPNYWDRNDAARAFAARYAKPAASRRRRSRPAPWARSRIACAPLPRRAPTTRARSWRRCARCRSTTS
jgi:branched-chain amino acid transport system substrate-binding protein